jgi:hypothetical protein
MRRCEGGEAYITMLQDDREISRNRLERGKGAQEPPTIFTANLVEEYAVGFHADLIQFSCTAVGSTVYCIADRVGSLPPT